MIFFGSKTIEQLQRELREKDEVLSNLEKENKTIHKKLVRFEKKESEEKRFKELAEELIPKEANARRNYMSDIALFYEKIMKDKIRHWISMQKEELSLVGRTPEQYEFFRACINCFRLIDDWLERCEREHLSNLHEKRQSFDEGSALIADVNKYLKK